MTSQVTENKWLKCTTEKVVIHNVNLKTIPEYKTHMRYIIQLSRLLVYKKFLITLDLSNQV